MSKDNKNIFLGTSGWNYKDWKNDFYSGVKQKNWLEFYASIFNAVEVNATFYRLLKDTTVSGWFDKTPADFSFAVKGSRYVTHTKRLNDPLEAVEKQKDNLSPLGKKLRAVIWQMPASFQKNLERLNIFCQALQNSWPEPDHAFEFRHTSWFDSEVENILSDYQLGICISDAADWPCWEKVSSNPVYIRLHGHTQTYRSFYTEPELQDWSQKITDWHDQGYRVHIYFDNTDSGAAWKNAMRLQEIVF